jgi:hypothetical protein
VSPSAVRSLDVPDALLFSDPFNLPSKLLLIHRLLVVAGGFL